MRHYLFCFLCLFLIACEKSDKAKSFAAEKSAFNDAVAQSIIFQLSSCWHMPDIKMEKLKLYGPVNVYVQYLPTGMVKEATIISPVSDKFRHDAQYLAYRASTIDAVASCSPINTNGADYDLWKEIQMRFDPKMEEL